MCFAHDGMGKRLFLAILNWTAHTHVFKRAHCPCKALEVSGAFDSQGSASGVNGEILSSRDKNHVSFKFKVVFRLMK